MCRTTVNISLIARSSIKVVSLQARHAAFLGALLVAASLPAGSLAAVARVNGGSSQPGPSVRVGLRAPDAAAGGGRYLVLQVRGSG